MNPTTRRDLRDFAADVSRDALAMAHTLLNLAGQTSGAVSDQLIVLAAAAELSADKATFIKDTAA